jgi:hypothetical protein
VTFAARAVTIAPGAVRRYDAEEWRGAIVWVARGALELECPGGGRARVRRGDLLWLAPLRLSALRNPGPGAAVLVAVARVRGGDR